jgi:hypothetical protein
MERDFSGFFQKRIDTAYQEQTWAVVITGSMNAFIASHTNLLLDAFSIWLLVAAISLVSFLAMAFVLSRHLIFMHYDQLLKSDLQKATARCLFPVRRVPKLYSLLARWSGVTLYLMIILGLGGTAVRMLFVSHLTNHLR